MNWFKRNIEVVTYLGAIVTTMIWMNGKFNDIDKQFANVDKQFSSLEKDIAVIKAVLVMKNIMPNEICKNNQEK